jgi:hypothetical protein
MLTQVCLLVHVCLLQSRSDDDDDRLAGSSDDEAVDVDSKQHDGSNLPDTIQARDHSSAPAVLGDTGTRRPSQLTPNAAFAFSAATAAGSMTVEIELADVSKSQTSGTSVSLLHASDVHSAHFDNSDISTPAGPGRYSTYLTEEGEPYYVHEVTGETVWVVPPGAIVIPAQQQ